MKHYTLLRFVKLNLYFFVMYSLLSAIWFGLTGRFAQEAGAVLGEIVLNAALFSLLFSLGVLAWYWRTELRITVKELPAKELTQRLEKLGFIKVAGQKPAQVSVFKPTPPQAPALAGKVFVQKKANFYLISGPARYLKKING